MSQKKKKTAIGRRDFIKKAGLGAGAVGAAAVGLSTKDSAAAEPTTVAPGGAGYRETAHVKKYYKLARF